MVCPGHPGGHTMAFVRIIDTDDNEHYIRYESIVNVRTTMSGGTFVDVVGLAAPIFVRKDARAMVKEITTGELLERVPEELSEDEPEAGGSRRPGGIGVPRA